MIGYKDKLVYDGKEIRVSDAVIEKHGREPYRLTFKGVLRPTIILGMLSDTFNSIDNKKVSFDNISFDKNISRFNINMSVETNYTFEIEFKSIKLYEVDELYDNISQVTKTPNMVSSFTCVIEDSNKKRIKCKNININFERNHSIITIDGCDEKLDEINIEFNSCEKFYHIGSIKFRVLQDFTNTSSYYIQTVEDIMCNLLYEPAERFL